LWHFSNQAKYDPNIVLVSIENQKIYNDLKSYKSWVRMSSQLFLKSISKARFYQFYYFRATENFEIFVELKQTNSNKHYSNGGN